MSPLEKAFNLPRNISISRDELYALAFRAALKTNVPLCAFFCFSFFFFYFVLLLRRALSNPSNSVRGQNMLAP